MKITAESLESAKRSQFFAVKSMTDIKSVNDVNMASREVRIVGNAYNFIDSDGDVLMPGCAKKSIKERGPASNAVAKIKAAKDHDLNKIPGVFTELEETEFQYSGKTYQGIVGTVRMSKSTLGNDQLIDYQDGVIDNHSIGFQYTNIQAVERGTKAFDNLLQNVINPKAADGRNWLYIVKEVNLFEVSSVAFGANSLTPYLGLKSLENTDAILFKLSSRLDNLENFYNDGKGDDESRQVFALQVRQIKQAMKEIIMHRPADDKEKARIAAEAEKRKGLDFGKMASEFVLY